MKRYFTEIFSQVFNRQIGREINDLSQKPSYNNYSGENRAYSKSEKKGGSKFFAELLQADRSGIERERAKKNADQADRQSGGRGGT